MSSWVTKLFLIISQPMIKIQIWERERKNSKTPYFSSKNKNNIYLK